MCQDISWLIVWHNTVLYNFLWNFTSKALGMNPKETILNKFELFSLPDGGIGNWISTETDDSVFRRLGKIDKEPLTRAQLNQLLTLGHEAPLSDGYFKYYWLSAPKKHPYDVKAIPGYQKNCQNSLVIESLDHLSWGLYRLYLDGLFWFGNIRAAYQFLRTKEFDFLNQFFIAKSFDTEAAKKRGDALELWSIAKDDRYLISEMACKSYDDTPNSNSTLKQALLEALETHSNKVGGRIRIRDLIENNIPKKFSERQGEIIFSADDILEDSVGSKMELEEKYEEIARKFLNARELALKNTKNYLSIVGELDVYVATSMRNREDFRNIAVLCEEIFSTENLQPLNLRYFDPTLSAAAGHEDKGLIECLMVKCAKVLIYCAGKSESFGKDAEAAMALSLGKPVIFYCTEDQKSRFYKEVHPLSRLIEFETGVAVGAMVTNSTNVVSDLLFRIFNNKMNYKLQRSDSGYFRLIEELTESVVRLQTDDRMLSETFWNYYHNR